MTGKGGNRPLSTAQAARFRSALGLLQGGRAGEAMELARQLAEEAPLAADAYQLHAMCAAEMGNARGAHTAFQRALELAPESQVVALNFSAWLGQQGRPREGLRALAGVTASVPVALRTGWLARQAGELTRARSAFDSVVSREPANVEGWLGLGSTLLDLGAYELAVAALRKATGLSENGRTGWVNLGLALRLLGKPTEALECLRRAASLGEPGPELEDAINGVLQDLGRTADAIEGARRLLVKHAGFAPGHETFAQLVWENGARLAPGVDPFSAFRAAARAQPANAELQRRYLRTLLGARRAAQAWEWLEHERRPRARLASG